ncbi:hypothetical protein P3T37_001575 [Kitasatospora sp. MAA4]|nr:hypothetical protein [Kitasatospora sp. MAA4]MDH6132190.1 hypothetical protein [Kitasatospora sp. MAA4]
MQDSPEASIAFMKHLLGEYPGLRPDIKRVIAERELGVTRM